MIEPVGAIKSRAELTKIDRFVLKIGSAVLATDPDHSFSRIASELSALRARSVQIIIVSSGAVALGFPLMGFQSRPCERNLLRASAAIGQAALMSRWRNAFDVHDLKAAQILLSDADLKKRDRYVTLKETLEALLYADIIPVINENDALSVTENKVGNNDALSADVAGAVGARLLVLMTSTNGLFTSDPAQDIDAKRIDYLYDTSLIAGDRAAQSSQFGTGGAATKLEAATTARVHNTATLILSGYDPHALSRALAGVDVGTFIPAVGDRKMTSRKRWIATRNRTRASVQIDDGAVNALLNGRSLLFAGVKLVNGQFEPGDVIDIVRLGGEVVGRGVAAVGSTATALVAGKKSAEAQKTLGKSIPTELVHRDNLVMLSDSL